MESKGGLWMSFRRNLLLVERNQLISRDVCVSERQAQQMAVYVSAEGWQTQALADGAGSGIQHANQ